MSATDLLVVGAGPGGASAALWARTLEMSVAVLESGAGAGGQLHQIHFEPANFAGGVRGAGPAIGARIGEQLAASGATLRFDDPAATLEPGARPAVLTRSGARHEAAAVLVATGVRRRRLEVPGERALEGRGVSYSATQDREGLAGLDVLVVGGGDAAFENALLLAAVGCRVTIAVRGAARARASFRARVAATPAIAVLEQTRVLELAGDARLEVARLEGPDGVRELPVGGVVIKVGILPNTEWCRDALALDGDGFVRVDARYATSAAGVWAVGDVTRPAVLGLPVAAGQGALAVDAIRAARGDS